VVQFYNVYFFRYVQGLLLFLSLNAEPAIAHNAVSSPPEKSEQPVLEVTHEVRRVGPFLNKVAICR